MRRQELGVEQEEALGDVRLRGIGDVVGNQEHPALPGTGLRLPVVGNQLVHDVVGLGQGLDRHPPDRHVGIGIVAGDPDVPFVVGAVAVLVGRDPVTQACPRVVLVVVGAVAEEVDEQRRHGPVVGRPEQEIAYGRRIEQTTREFVVDIANVDDHRLEGIAEAVVASPPGRQPLRC